MGNNQIKVAEGLFRKANERNLLQYLKVWYALKSKKIDGFYKDNSIYLDLEYSNSFKYKIIKVLTENNLIRKEYNGYQLVSYDDLFKEFDYDMNLKISSTLIRRGKFKIFKIKKQHLSNFLEKVCLEEIRLKLSRMKYKFREALKQKSSKLDKTFKANISNRTISSLFGYTSSQTGNSILAKLTKLGWLKLEKKFDSNNLPLCNILLLS